MSEDGGQPEFRVLREQASGALRALAFRGGQPAAEQVIDTRILEVMMLVNETFRGLVPGGISFGWAGAPSAGPTRIYSSM